MGINDATTPETVLFQDILHHKVVVVGIYPDIVAMLETPFEAGVSYSLLFAVGSHAVNDVIWFVVQPVAVINAGIRRVLSGNKTEMCLLFLRFHFRKHSWCRWLFLAESIQRKDNRLSIDWGCHVLS